MFHSREKASHLLFPQLSEVLRSFLATALLLYWNPYANALSKRWPTERPTIESTKLAPAWGMHPYKPGTALLCAHHLILRVLPEVTLVSSSAQRVNRELAFRPSSSMADGTCHWGFDLHHYFCGGSECLVLWKHGALPPGPRHLGLQYGFRVMRSVGWVTGKSQTTLWNKSPFCPPAPPTPDLKATSKTDHSDGTEEHARKEGWMGRCVLACSRHTQSYSVARFHTIEFSPPSCSGFGPFSLSNGCGVSVHTSRWWPATGGLGAGSSARAPLWNCLFPLTSCTCSG